jgi:hypothetical protein
MMDAALRPQPKRSGVEWWATPSDLIDALITHVLPLLPDGAIWECAAGDGRLAEAIRAAGRHVIASDIAPQDATILLGDFLTGHPNRSVARSWFRIRFRSLDRFIARGLELHDTGQIAALRCAALRRNATSAAGRASALNRAARVTCCWRPTWRAPAFAAGRRSLPAHRGSRSRGKFPTTRLAYLPISEQHPGHWALPV